MKKIIAIILLVSALLSLVACDQESSVEQPQWDKLEITKDNIFDYFKIVRIGMIPETHYNSQGELSYYLTRYDLQFVLKENLSSDEYSIYHPYNGDANLIITVKGTKLQDSPEHANAETNYVTMGSMQGHVSFKYSYSLTELDENESYRTQYMTSDFLDPNFGFVINVEGYIYKKGS